MESPEKILVVGPSWVGDMVMAQSLFQVLAARRPGVVIDVLAPAWSEPLLERMPQVRRSVIMPAGHGEFRLRDRGVLGRSLRHEDYTRAIVLPRSWKSALVPWFARIPERTGFRGEWRYGVLTDLRSLDRGRLDQTVKRFVALGLAPDEQLTDFPPPQLMVSKENCGELRRRLGLGSDAAVVAMMPGAAYGPAKCWPLEYFSDLAGRLIAAGLQIWVLGSAGDQPAGEQIAAGRDAVHNLCGQTLLEDTVDLLSEAAVTVTNDSGLMHVAAAVGTHVVAVYGSTSPAYTPPLTDNRTIEYLALECSPCFKRECPLGHLRCLRDLLPDQLFAAVMAQVRPQN